MHAPAAGSKPVPVVGTAYRPEIDGLRAVAVMSVVVFHAFPHALRGGFVGVDIFFVISGFLITSIIVADLANGSFRLRTFYARRVKRIFPALIVVLLAVLLLGCILLYTDEYKELGKQVAASAGFAANLLFWKEANYFDLAAETKPLLHLWSLGIEEQYYILWPLLLWLCWRTRKRALPYLVGLLLVGSFLLNIRAMGTSPTEAFYSPLTRAWELFAGGLLAIASSPYTRPLLGAVPDTGHRSPISNRLAASGIVLLAASLILISRNTPFPGWAALLPVAATCMLVGAGPSSWVARRILSHPVLVGIGLISYPLYLWHWPLLVLTRAWMGEAGSAPLRCGVVALSAGLAWITYRFLERPIRFGQSPLRSLPLLGGALATLAGIGALAMTYGWTFQPGDLNSYAAYFDSFRTGVSPAREELVEINQNQCNFYNFESALPTRVPRDGISPDCYTSHSRRTVLLWGDSHSAHLFYGLRKTLPADTSLLLVYASGCRPHPIDLAKLTTDYCEMSNSFALSTIKNVVPDVVVISFNNSFDTEYLREASREIKRIGVKRVIVLGLAPHWEPFLFKVVMQHYWQFTPARIATHLDQHALGIDKAFRNELQADEPFEYQSLHDFFCNREGCLIYLDRNRREGLVSFDNAHLRPLASLYLAEHLLTPLIQRDVRPLGLRDDAQPQRGRTGALDDRPAVQ
ncbi:acyltransferase family protein [Bradyrhizobium sp. HKCCYLRH3061]|uniref:acyltransferase family protein n=1 Tax=Bradyrhizobium sp. HKCCYLRH3061 TaxID=3420734 RepID=UPI003EB95F43